MARTYQPPTHNQSLPEDGVAIIGMSCLFPGAKDLEAYWENILNKFDAVSEPPAEAWDPDIYYDPELTDSDKVYCQRGGYLGSLVSFSPLAYGVPPMSVGGEPDQWLALKLAHDAMHDAGCDDLPEEIRHRTAVVLGKGTYLNGGNATAIQRTLIVGQTIELIRKLNPEIDDARIELLREEMKRILPPMTAETVPGLIPNIIVGRIANRLDLMGPTYTVDAACASSLIAIQLAMRDLLSGECDLALAGGSQVWMPVAALNVFCRLGALSHDQQIRPFDKDANGTLLGEGIGMVVLKRLADAERDGDRIYAVLRGVGVASDGRGVSVMAPRIDGEIMALRRAYEDAGVSPDTIGLVEAHGTATAVGDVVEVQALTQVFGTRNGGLPRVALGTVKSMISHTIPAAGVAGIIKTAMALHQKVLPPTLHVREPNPKLELEKTPFYLNTEPRPWIHGALEPRRAGVNAFGFGGINAHAVLEEFRPTENRESEIRHLPRWDSEIFLLGGATKEAIREQAVRLAEQVRRLSDQPEGPVALVDLAYTVNCDFDADSSALRLAVVASSYEDLLAKLDRAATRLADPGCRRIKDVSGIFFFAELLGRAGKVALLFPGEGAQYQNMLADLCLHFPEVREVFDRYDRIFHDHPRGDVPSDYIFPRPAFDDETRRYNLDRLMQMDLAIEAVQAANQAMFALLQRLGLRGDACVGHSSGEYSAATAAGVFDVDSDERFIALGRALYDYYASAKSHDGVPRATLLAIAAPREQVEAIAKEAGGDIYLAVENCPHQAVLIGEPAAAERARALVERQGLIYEQLAYDRAVHTPLFEPFTADLRRLYEQVPVRPATMPLYSCATTKRYPDDPADIREIFLRHWSRPVEFQRTIEALYDEGCRVFIEVGPRGNLSAFVEDILRGRPSCVIPANVMRRSGITQLNHLVGMLAAHGVDLDLDYLYSRRNAQRLSLGATDDKPRRFDDMLLSSSWPMIRLSDEIVAAVRPTEPVTHVHNSVATPGAESVVEAPSPAVETVHRHDVAEYEEIGTWQASTPESALVAQQPVAYGDDAAAFLTGHLSVMEEFLTTQQEIMHAFLSGMSDQTHSESNHAEPQQQMHDPSDAGADAVFPLLGQVVFHEPGRTLVAERVFDVRHDRYLLDHTFGRDISRTEPTLAGLAIMPLTMSLEIIAEAAACLLPGLQVVGMQDVFASRWLAWDEEPQTLRVTASRVADGEGHACVHVALYNLSEPLAGAGDAMSAVVEAMVVLAPSMPAGGAPSIAPPVDARPSRWTPDRLYQDVMFHGPTWQGVSSIDQTGDRGIVATLTVHPTAGFFADPTPVQFVLDPVMLDAAGQAIGFWTTEHLPNANVIFPYRLRSLEIYRATPPAGTPVRCVAQIELHGEQVVRSDIELVLPDGQVWMRLVGWEDKRFDVPAHLHDLILSRGGTVSSSVPSLIGAAASPVRCRIVDTRVGGDRAFWVRVWSQRILSCAERHRFAELRLPDNRRLEWLGARSAAKEVIVELVRERAGIDLLPADIEIVTGPDGQPIVTGVCVEALGAAPLVSFSHTDGVAAAVVATADQMQAVGFDIEFVKDRQAGFDEIAFTDHERALVSTVSPEHSAEWLLRCWCAKEAVGKAFGTGMDGGPRSLAIVAIDPSAGWVDVQSVRSHTVLSAQTHRVDSLVSALAVVTRGSP